MNETIRGSELKVGMTVAVWWGRETIVALRPYTGPLAHYFEAGAQTAEFASARKMTVDNDELNVVFAR